MAEAVVPAPPMTEWPPYWKQCFVDIGQQCATCGGALTFQTKVASEPPDAVIVHAIRCLWCGAGL